MHFRTISIKIMSTVLCASLLSATVLPVYAEEGAEAQVASQELEQQTQVSAPAQETAQPVTATQAENAAEASQQAEQVVPTESNTVQTQAPEEQNKEVAKKDTVKAESTSQQEQSVEPQAEEQPVDPANSRSYIPNQQCTDEQLNNWFADAGFVGNSIGVGLASYIKRQGAGFLGGPKLMVKGSYSFLNDGKSNPKYRIDYNGFNGPAREVVAKSGVKKVFINMGTNDLWEAPSKAYQRYVDYIQGIRQSSPGIIVFVEATTAVTPGHENRGLSNKNVDELNSLIKNYCAGQKNVYYIDINSPMKENGALKTSLSSDKDVHLTNTAYKIWMNTVIRFVDNRLKSGVLQ